MEFDLTSLVLLVFVWHVIKGVYKSWVEVYRLGPKLRRRYAKPKPLSTTKLGHLKNEPLVRMKRRTAWN